MSESPARAIVHHGATLSVQTDGQGFYRLGKMIESRLSSMRSQNGLLSVFVAHTSASLCIQENADPNVLSDLTDALERFAPKNATYRHSAEGPDDMPAHIKTLLTSVSLSIPVREGRLALGTWQEVYLIEHRTAPHCRRIEIDYIGEVLSE